MGSSSGEDKLGQGRVGHLRNMPRRYRKHSTHTHTHTHTHTFFSGREVEQTEPVAPRARSSAFGAAHGDDCRRDNIAPLFEVRLHVLQQQQQQQQQQRRGEST